MSHEEYSIKSNNHLSLHESVASEFALLVGEPEDEEVHFVQFAQPLYRDRVELLE